MLILEYSKEEHITYIICNECKAREKLCDGQAHRIFAYPLPEGWATYRFFGTADGAYCPKAECQKILDCICGKIKND